MCPWVLVFNHCHSTLLLGTMHFPWQRKRKRKRGWEREKERGERTSNFFSKFIKLWYQSQGFPELLHVHYIVPQFPICPFCSIFYTSMHCSVPVGWPPQWPWLPFDVSQCPILTFVASLNPVYNFEMSLLLSNCLIIHLFLARMLTTRTYIKYYTYEQTLLFKMSVIIAY